MGAGATAGFKTAVATLSEDELKEIVASMDQASRDKLMQALPGNCEAKKEPASEPAAAAPAEEAPPPPAIEMEECAVKKALIVATSADKLGDHATGAWSEEICGPFFVFYDGGLEVTVASIAGGDIPIDAGSLSDTFKTDNDTRMMDRNCGPLKGTKKLSEVDVAAYHIIFFAGGHGTCVDFPTDEVGQAVSKAYAAGRVVGAVCHGPMALVKATCEGGEPLVKGKKVACFTDVEEEHVKLTDKVPFLLEAKMKELGAEVQVGEPWSDKAVRDGRLVTGQNPQSSVSAAKLTLEAAGIQK